ncbi:hypothetical protein ACFL21_04625 [Patescibacteria group bacterium]
MKEAGPIEVFESMGFKKVDFSALPEDVREEIIKAWKGGPGKRWSYAKPRKRQMLEGADWGHLQIVANDDFSTLYFFYILHGNRYWELSWTRLSQEENGYNPRSMNHDTNPDEFVSSLTLYEARDDIAREVTQAIQEEEIN